MLRCGVHRPLAWTATRHPNPPAWLRSPAADLNSLPPHRTQVTTKMALQLVEKNRQQLKFAQRKLEDSLALLKQSLGETS
jgi:hypothetical protein